MKNSVFFTCLKLTGHCHLKCKAFSDFFNEILQSSILPVPWMDVNENIRLYIYLYICCRRWRTDRELKGVFIDYNNIWSVNHDTCKTISECVIIQLMLTTNVY